MIDYKDAKYIELKGEFEPKFKELLDKIKSYYDLPAEEEEKIRMAYHLALYAHRDQLRKSGEPYFVHLLAVANFLADLKIDIPTIIGGLLHDVVEDTFVNKEELADMFDESIAEMVDGVTKISEISGKLGTQFRQAENFRKMLLSMTNDVRVLLIKLADRWHNMSTLEHMPAKKRERIAEETLEVYAPLAHRFGMGKIKSELEDLAFKFLDNKEFQILARQINEKKEEREEYVQKIIAPIKEELSKHKKKFEIYGRPKHLYSIHQKIVKRNKKFEEIYDLFAIRILVESVEDCYFSLGIIHQLYIPVYDRFKDYISVPKTNGYQSLHTTILGPEGRLVEVQIRTYDMHLVAEKGIAAHWIYKEHPSGKKPNKTIIKDYQENISQIRNLLENYQEQNPTDFMNDLKIELYEDDVFVFTPKGDVFKLPQGSTPIDFAFAVHTNVGLHCIGAKVNNRIVSLKTELKSGEIVEIITSQNQHPRDDWLKIVKTSKARNRIKKYLKEEKFEEDVRNGKELLESELKKSRVPKENVDIKKLVETFKQKSPESLYAAISRGDVSITKILSVLDIKPVSKSPSLISKLFNRQKFDESILVDGNDNIDVRLAGCCNPLPGDEIVGYITKNNGITIHQKECPNLLRMIDVDDRAVSVDWGQTKNLYHKAQIYIDAEDRKNLLRDITSILSNNNSGIINIEMRRNGKSVLGNLVIEVISLDQLKKIMIQLRREKGVRIVERKQSQNRTIKTN